MEERLPFGKRAPVDPAEYCAANPDSQTFVCEFGIWKRSVPCSGASDSFLDDLADAADVGSTAFETLTEEVDGAATVLAPVVEKVVAEVQVAAQPVVELEAGVQAAAEAIVEGAMEVAAGVQASVEPAVEAAVEVATGVQAAAEPIVEGAMEVAVGVQAAVEPVAEAVVEAVVEPQGFTEPPDGFRAVHRHRRGACLNKEDVNVFIRRLPGEYTYTEAENTCGETGGRLCTVDEAWDKCAGYLTGLSYDDKTVWTSSYKDGTGMLTCPAGSHIVSVGKGNVRNAAVPECVADNEKHKAQCCATRLV